MRRDSARIQNRFRIYHFRMRRERIGFVGQYSSPILSFFLKRKHLPGTGPPISRRLLRFCSGGLRSRSHLSSSVGTLQSNVSPALARLPSAVGPVLRRSRSRSKRAQVPRKACKPPEPRPLSNPCLGPLGASHPFGGAIG